MPVYQVVVTKEQIMLQMLIPFAFVILWSTGFVATKYGLAYATPLAYLTLRMASNLICFAFLMLIFKAKQPTWPHKRHLLMCGLLMHATYLAGSFLAIHWGMPMGLASLVVGAQPLLTALLSATILKQHLRPVQWLGLLVGLGGLLLVVYTQATAAHGQPVNLSAIGAILFSLVGITAGTMYQKHFCSQMDMISGAFWQYLAAFTALAIAMVLTEDAQIAWTGPFILALGWSSLVISVAAMLLLMHLIRRGDATRVSSLFYLVPPIAALLGYFLFDEQLSLNALLGGAVTVVAVVLVSRSARTSAKGATLR